MQTKADALKGKGETAAERRVLEQALRAAQQIGVKQARDRNVEKILKTLRDAK